jgi:glycerate kinase
VNARRFLLAPDAFKGTFTAAEAAGAIARGLRSRGALADELPVADGGEGTIEVLLQALGGEERTARCRDPLGRVIEARWAWLPATATAIVEMARASGLALLREDELDAEGATSVGTGELILAARDAGARETMLAVGGTATSDGGRGATETIAAAGGLGQMRLVLACDVVVPFERAAEVFGPQKGASPETVARLTERLHDLAASLPRDPRGRPMTGAGGGLAGAMWSLYGAELRSGAREVLAALDFDSRLAAADAVVVGEGRLDEQSRRGKVAGEILDRAEARAMPVHAIVGSLRGARTGEEWGSLASVQLASSIAELERAGAALASAP